MHAAPSPTADAATHATAAAAISSEAAAVLICDDPVTKKVLQK